MDWRPGPNFVTASELLSQLVHTARKYDAIELLPHEPPITGVYYRCDAIELGDGSFLNQLLDRFRPATIDDRNLLQAAFLTLFWGGPPGARPAFVITSDQGRGVGKSKVAEIAGRLCQGALDVSAGEDIGELKKRMLSPDGQTKRVAILDNVKSRRFSWAELEALITSPWISGRRMYVGEAQRPNLLTWFITLNGVNMTTDMAQRSVMIKMAKGENRGTWYEDTTRFIDNHRQQFIGDIIAILRSESTPLSKFSRWATWEKDILSRVSDPEKAQALICERQNDANCELDEAQAIEQHFADQLSALEYNPDLDRIRIPNPFMGQWFSTAVGQPTSTISASKRLRQMIDEGQIKRLKVDSSNAHGRSYVWIGTQADHSVSVFQDLEQRISRAAAA